MKITVTIEDDSLKGTFAMESDWAKKAVKAFNESQQKDQRKTEEFLALEKIKTTRAPQLWVDLRSRIKGKVDSFNAELGRAHLAWGSPQTNSVTVRLNGDSKSILEGEYDDSIQLATFKVRALEMRLQIIASSTTRDVQFVDIDTKKHADVEEVAERLINTALNIEGVDSFLR